MGRKKRKGKLLFDNSILEDVVKRFENSSVKVYELEREVAHEMFDNLKDNLILEDITNITVSKVYKISERLAEYLNKDYLMIKRKDYNRGKNA